MMTKYEEKRASFLMGLIREGKNMVHLEIWKLEIICVPPLYEFIFDRQLQFTIFQEPQF